MDSHASRHRRCEKAALRPQDETRRPAYSYARQYRVRGSSSTPGSVTARAGKPTMSPSAEDDVVDEEDRLRDEPDDSDRLLSDERVDSERTTPWPASLRT